MRKLVFLLLIALCTFANAAPVDKQQALQAAMRFMKTRQQTAKTRSQTAKQQPKLTLAMQRAKAFYVFNNANGRGFVITSADDRTDAVLGYSDTGSFDVKNIPVNMADLLDMYETEIRLLDRYGVKNAKQNTQETRAVGMVKKSIVPMIATRWNQDSPYNDLCPVVEVTRTVTGCVATAMAQVINYHRCPQGMMRDTIPGYMAQDLQKQLKKQPPIAFKWDKLRNVYDKTSRRDEQMEVAKLMKYCGYAVHMNYATPNKGGSGAYANEIPYALTTYFGYSKTARYVERASFNTKTWNNMIYKELSEGRPVLYGGVSPMGGGHEFVCDGYDYGDYFHINWGWGGMSDGYFRLFILSPEQQGIGSYDGGYALHQCAIVGVQPDHGEKQPDVMTAIDLHAQGKNKRFMRDDVTKGFDKLNVTLEMYNYGTLPYVGNVGLALYQDGRMVQIASEGEEGEYLPMTQALPKCAFSLNGFAANLKGQYALVPVCKQKGSDEWVECPGSEKCRLNLNITETEMTFDVVNSKNVHLKLESVEFPKVLKAMTQNVVRVKITNNGLDFNGSLGFAFHRRQSTVAVAIEPNTTVEVDFTFQTDTACVNHPYRIYVVDPNMQGELKYLGKGRISVVKGLEVPDDSLSADVFCDNVAGEKAFYGPVIKGRFVVKNRADEDYDRGFAIGIINTRRETSSLQYRQFNIVVPANGTAELPFEFGNLQVGTTYNIILMGYDGLYNQGNAIARGEATCKPGIVKYLSSGAMECLPPEGDIDLHDAIAADLSDADVERLANVKLSGSPSCIYYFGDAANVPQAFADKNVVKGNEAENIVLHDGQPLFILRDFTARNIAYKRVFNAVNNTGDNGWTTISLPFGVNAVTVGGQELRFFVNNADKNKDVRLLNFVGEEGIDMHFAYTNALKAGMPYLISLADNATTRAKGETLQGKEITFAGKDAAIQADMRSVLTGDNYRFAGAIDTQKLPQAYVFSTADNRFNLVESGKTQPFSACFVPNEMRQGNVTKWLNIVVDDTTTGISDVKRDANDNFVVYSLEGVALGKGKATLQKLPNGVYIVNGKKMMK